MIKQILYAILITIICYCIKTFTDSDGLLFAFAFAFGCYYESKFKISNE